MPSDIRIEGAKELIKKLKDNATLDDVKRVVRTRGILMEKSIKTKASHSGLYKKGYSKGGIKQSTVGQTDLGGLSYTVGTPQEYAPYVEYGTRFMEPEPAFKKGYEEQQAKFKKDMDRLTR